MGNGYEVRSFGDRFSGGISHYVDWMTERVTLIHQKLKTTGSMFLHCDYHASHRLRVMMDTIFGEQNFRSEIIWKRTSAHGDSGTFGNIHDAIFMFSKSSKFYFKPIKTDYEEWYVERYYRYKDDDGRRFMSDNLSASGLSGGGYQYKWKGKDGYWRCPIDLPGLTGSIRCVKMGPENGGQNGEKALQSRRNNPTFTHG